MARFIARDPATVLRQVPGFYFVEAALQTHVVASGERGVLDWLANRLSRAGRHDAYLLVGTRHDSAGQIRAFERLIGPNGIASLTHVVAEQFAATGAWSGIPQREQRGDTERLHRYVTVGDEASFATLRSAHDARDYAAWKFDYASDVLDLAVMARVRGLTLDGADLPAAVVSHLSYPVGDLGSLRELHAWLSLRDALASTPGPHRIAMLWGEEHVEAQGFRRFIPRDATAVSLYLFGQRPGETIAHDDGGPMESALRQGWVFNDVVAAAFDPDEEHVVVLLPDPWIGGDVDRVRSRRVESDSPTPAAFGTVVVRSNRAGRFTLDGSTVDIAANPVSVPAARGRHTYLFASESLRTMGAIDSSAGEGVEIDFDPASRATRIHYVTE